MKEDSERAECLRICKEIYALGHYLRDCGHQVVFAREKKDYKPPSGRNSNYRYDFYLCTEILAECEKILDAGYNPEFTCENKQLQEYVEVMGELPDHATLLGLRYKGARKGGSR